MNGRPEKIEEFGKWLHDSPFSAIIIIAGNNGILFQKKPEKAKKLLSKHDKIHYLRIVGAESTVSHFIVRHDNLSPVTDRHLPSIRNRN